jgi:hypothetical protein
MNALVIDPGINNNPASSGPTKQIIVYIGIIKGKFNNQNQE